MPNLKLPYMKEATNNMWKTIKHLEEKDLNSSKIGKHKVLNNFYNILNMLINILYLITDNREQSKDYTNYI